MTDPLYDPISKGTREIIQRFRHGPKLPPTPPGGGSFRDGDNDDMNAARILKLEEFAEDAKQRLSRVETKLDHIDKEVSNFKWWVLAQIVAALLTVIGTGIAIQQMTVSTFVAAGAQVTQAAQQQQPIIIQMPQAAPAPAPTATPAN